VEARIPVPIAPEGDHYLQLSVDEPQRVVSEPIRILRVSRSASALRLIEPEDGVVAGEPRPFRWTLVPGAEAYEVVFSDEDRENAGSKRFRTVQAEWLPGAQDWKEIVPVGKFWAVRPIYPVDVRGSLSAWNRLAAVPDHVALSIEPPVRTPEGTRFAWSGGAVGLLYRVSVTSADELAAPVFSALTFRRTYELRAALLPRSDLKDLAVTIEAVSPEGHVVGSSGPSAFAIGQPLPAAARTSLALVSSSPGDGAEIATLSPSLAAPLDGFDDRDDLAILLDGTDVTDLLRFVGDEWRYVPYLPLEAGPHRVILRSARRESGFAFCAAPADDTPSGAAAPAPRKGPDWKVDASGMVTVISGDRPDQHDSVHAAISSSESYSPGPWSAAETADIAFHHDINDPHRTIQESRKWLAKGSVGNDTWKASGAAGYATSTLADQMQLLNTGLVRGAAELAAHTPVGSFGGFETFDDQFQGVFSSNLGRQQRLKVASYDAPLPPDHFVLRGLYLETDDFGKAAIPIARSRGRAYGGLGKWIASPKFTLLVEGAHGTFHRDGSTEVSGNAFRANATGSAGKTSYSLNFHRTDSDFVNPASPSLTTASTPNRTGGEASLSEMIGKGSARLSYTYLHSGRVSGFSSEADHHDGGLTLSWPLSAKVTSSLNGTYSVDRADAAQGITGALPETDRDQYGGTLSLQETLGKISLSETATRSRYDDKITSTNTKTSTYANVSASGDLLPMLNLSSNASLTRSENSIAGRSDTLQFLLQPTLRWTATGLSLVPRASYTRSDTSVSAIVTRMEQYQMLLQWACPPAKTLATVGLSAQWDRNRSDGPLPPGTGFVRRYTATLTLRWGASSPPPKPPSALLPPDRRSPFPMETAVIQPIVPPRGSPL
jgi:hypothetical protein